MSIVEKYVDSDYPFFQTSEPAASTLAQFEELGLDLAPVLKDENFQGLIHISSLREAMASEVGEGREMALQSLPLQECHIADPEEHIMDVFGRFAGISDPDYLCVVSKDGVFRGMLSKTEAIRAIGRIFHVSEGGVTLELEAPALGVNVSEIVGVIEKNDATVLSFGITEPEPGDQMMVMTFRLHSGDVYRLVKNLEKYGYYIRYARPTAGDGVDELREKALEFMRYIDM